MVTAYDKVYCTFGFHISGILKRGRLNYETILSCYVKYFKNQTEPNDEGTDEGNREEDINQGDAYLYIYIYIICNVYISIGTQMYLNTYLHIYLFQWNMSISGYLWKRRIH